MIMIWFLSNDRLSTTGKLLKAAEAQIMEGSEQLYGGFLGRTVGLLEVNAVRVGQRPLCTGGCVSQMRTLRHMRSAVFAMTPSLICGALVTGKSGLLVTGVCSVDIFGNAESKLE